MKTCTKCGLDQPVSAFGKNAYARDGLRSHCKACTNASMAARKAANPEKYRAIDRRSAAKRRADDPQHAREINRKANAVYRSKNRERLAAWQRDYYRTAAGRVTAEQKGARRRARQFNAEHEPYSRRAIFAAYNGTCAYCDAPAEHLDHVVPLSRGGADAAHNLLPACAPCNLSKHAKSLAEWALTFGP